MKTIEYMVYVTRNFTKSEAHPQNCQRISAKWPKDIRGFVEEHLYIYQNRQRHSQNCHGIIVLYSKNSLW